MKHISYKFNKINFLEHCRYIGKKSKWLNKNTFRRNVQIICSRKRTNIPNDLYFKKTYKIEKFIGRNNF